MTDDGTFEELDKAEALGPEAILVCGFGPEVEPVLGEVLDSIGQGGHRVVRCTAGMVQQRLGEALESPADDEPAPADALPRAVVLSGLSGAGIQAFLRAYDAAGLARPIFASATPSNLSFLVRDLLRELLAEDRAMRGRSG